jgi:Zn-dependent protease with chaperone function
LTYSAAGARSLYVSMALVGSRGDKVRGKVSLGWSRRSAGAHGLLALPWLLASAVLVWQLAGAALNPVGSVLVFAGWLASGALTLWPSFESFLTRVAFRFRPLTAVERDVVETAWAAVTERAGQPVDQYRLSISDSAEINASTHAGRTVAVTRRIVEFPQPQVAATLAHELGHHLGWHPTVSLLIYWYSSPARILRWLLVLVWLVASALVSLVLWVARPLAHVISTKSRSDEGPMLSLAVSLVGVAIRVVSIAIPVAAMLYVTLLYPWLLLIPVLPPVAAALERAEEHRSDRVACELGYAEDLVSLLRRAALLVQDAKVPWWRRLLTPHPPIGARVRRVERYLAAQQIRASGVQEPPRP